MNEPIQKILELREFHMRVRERTPDNKKKLIAQASINTINDVLDILGYEEDLEQLINDISD